MPAGCSIPKELHDGHSVRSAVACIPQSCLAPGVTQANSGGLQDCSAKYPATDLIAPEQAEYNVLSLYFSGTAAAPFFGGNEGRAPLNYLQICAQDIQYATAHATTQAQIVEAGGSSAVLAAQDLLNLASEELQAIAEAPALPCNPLP